MGKVAGLGELRTIRAGLRREGKKVVFTNGVFDLIHRGHVEYLTKAKALGDILIVGVNDDASVRRIKGSKRPLVEEADRAFVVANLSPVDYAILFSDDTPLEIITALVPDVLVKGADWKVDDIVGKDVVEKAGGKVSNIDIVPDRSTTGLVDRILKRFSEP